MRSTSFRYCGYAVLAGMLAIGLSGAALAAAQRDAAISCDKMSLSRCMSSIEAGYAVTIEGNAHFDDKPVNASIRQRSPLDATVAALESAGVEDYAVSFDKKQSKIRIELLGKNAKNAIAAAASTEIKLPEARQPETAPAEARQAEVKPTETKPAEAAPSADRQSFYQQFYRQDAAASEGQAPGEARPQQAGPAAVAPQNAPGSDKPADGAVAADKATTVSMLNPVTSSMLNPAPEPGQPAGNAATVKQSEPAEAATADAGQPAPAAADQAANQEQASGPVMVAAINAPDPREMPDDFVWTDRVSQSPETSQEAASADTSGPAAPPAEAGSQPDGQSPANAVESAPGQNPS